MIIIYFISKNNLKKGRNKTEFVELYGPISNFVFIGEISPLREARNHTDRIDARKKLTPIRYLKAYPRFYYVTNFILGSPPLTGWMCAPSDRPRMFIRVRNPQKECNRG